MTYQHYYEFMIGPVMRKVQERCNNSFSSYLFEIFYDELAMQICHRFMTFVGYPL